MLMWHPKRIVSGDVQTALLQPHQLLISPEDAEQLGFMHSRSWMVIKSHEDSSRMTIVEMLIDQPTDHGGVPLGYLQVHPWIVDMFNLHDDDEVVVSLCQPDNKNTTIRPMLTLQVHGRHPLNITSTTELSLPESVRNGMVNLHQAVIRQVRATFGLTQIQSCFHSKMLLVIRLVGELFVFRVVNITSMPSNKHTSLDFQVEIVDYPRPTDIVSQLTTNLTHLSLQAASSMDTTLSYRFWQHGWVGYDAVFTSVWFHVMLNFKSIAISSSLTCRGLLVNGVPGVGKSLFLRVLESELQRQEITAWRIDATSLLMQYQIAATSSAYTFLVAQLKQFTDSTVNGVVLIDDLDMLFQSPTSKDTEEGVLTQLPLGSALLRLLDSQTSDSTSPKVVIVGTTTSLKLPQCVYRSGRFDKSIEVIVPTETMRRDIILRQIERFPLESTPSTTTSEEAGRISTSLATLTGGYVAKDLVRICRKAYIHAHRPSAPAAVVQYDHFLDAKRHVFPSQLQQLNVASPGSRIHGFVGYASVQQQLSDCFQWKFHPTEAMKVCNSTIHMETKD